MRRRVKGEVLILAALLCCTGCITNYYEEFYVDSLGERETASAHGDASVILQTIRTEEDVIKLIESGYVRSGISSFQGPYTSFSCAVDAAEKHGAALVLFDVRLRETNHCASVMYRVPCPVGAGISPGDALPLRYSPSLQRTCDIEKKNEELAERKYEADRRARFSRKGRFLWFRTYSLDDEAIKYPDEESDPRYYNILVGGANAAGEGFSALSALPFGAFAKGDNKELFGHAEVQEIRKAIERAVRQGKNVRVFGHSWGGAVVANLAPEYPEIPFYALDPVSWTGVPDEIPRNLTIYHPRGTDDIDFPRMAQILGRQWPIIKKGKGKTVYYDGDHVTGVRREMNELNKRLKKEKVSALSATARMNAAPAKRNADIYDHDVMFFKKMDTSSLYGVYWDVPRRLPTETAESPITVRILAVLHGSPAEKDGIKRGQVVKAINGVAIKTRADIAPYVKRETCIKTLEVEGAR